MLDIALRYENSLVPFQTLCLACVVESFNFLIHSSYCLDLSFLVYGSGDREVLLDWKVGEGGEDRVEFSAGRAVSINSAIALFEDKPASYAQRLVACVLVFQITRYYQNPFRV